jgi:Alg9-like mannosyltransferase family
MPKPPDYPSAQGHTHGPGKDLSAPPHEYCVSVCSSQYALRAYVYLLLHAIVAAPAALLFGAEGGKLLVFYATRAALGLVSAATEAMLYRCPTHERLLPVAGTCTLVLHCFAPHYAPAEYQRLPRKQGAGMPHAVTEVRTLLMAAR